MDAAQQATQKIEVKRLQMRIQQLALNKTQMEIRICEIEEEKRRIEENFPLWEKEVADIKAQIKQLNPSAFVE